MLNLHEISQDKVHYQVNETELAYSELDNVNDTDKASNGLNPLPDQLEHVVVDIVQIIIKNPD
jgi:hypothetical protein